MAIAMPLGSCYGVGRDVMACSVSSCSSIRVLSLPAASGGFAERKRRDELDRVGAAWGLRVIRRAAGRTRRGSRLVTVDSDVEEVGKPVSPFTTGVAAGGAGEPASSLAQGGATPRKQASPLVQPGVGKDEIKDGERVRKPPGGVRRAARHAVSVVLQVDRIRLKDIEKMSRKTARLLPQALIEALNERIRASQWEQALKVFELLRQQEWYEPKPEQYIKLLSLLAKCKEPDPASVLFKEMLVEKLPPSVESFTALLSAHMRSGRVDTAFKLFGRMKTLADCQPDVYTYSILIEGCCQTGQYDKASLLLDEMQEVGVEPNTVTYNTLIEAFGKAGMLREMEELFIDMLQSPTCKADTWSWNIILKAFGRKGNIRKMEQWYEEMQAADAKPDVVTLNTMVNVYGKEGLFEKMRAVATYMRRYFFTLNDVTFNSMVEAYGKAGMITEMEATYLAMKRQGVKPTPFTLTCLLSAYSKKAMWDKVDKIRREWDNSDLRPDVVLYNSLIDAYRRSGNISRVEAAFQEMEQILRPDHITYTILAQAYRSHGLRDKAEEMDARMKDLRKQKP